MNVNVLGIMLLIILAVSIIILCRFSIEDEIKSGAIIKVGYDIFTIVAMFIGIIICIFYIIKEVTTEEARYPSTNYKIETEITSRGEVSDTTYIIIKK